MKLKKHLAVALCAAFLISLTACGSSDETAVFVQSVQELSGFGGIAPGDRFAGLVVSENTAKIEKDAGQSVQTLFVREGDSVTEGQELFCYDTDQLQLDLDKKRLELEQLKASIENYKEQIEDLEYERDRAPSSERLDYTIQIQTTQLDLKEAELNLKAKETEVAQAEKILENATVVSPVAGRIQSIQENGMDNYGNPLPYITIQQDGAYRIKGMVGELQRGSLMEGTRVRIFSRTDDREWYGTVALIDYENPSQGSQYDMYYGMATDEMTSSSKYPFYVELESTKDLLLGQHVYMELDTGDTDTSGLYISSWFICYDEDGNSYVWADRRGKLEKRLVTVGEYNPMQDTVQILSGLTQEDYIASPDPELCQEGAPTTRVLETFVEEGVMMG